MIDTIYLDMDGVLADFDKRYTELFGAQPDLIKKKNWNENWNTFVKGGNFRVLDWYPRAEEFLRGIEDLVEEYYDENAIWINVEILSSSGGEEMYEDISNQKKQWLLNRGILYRANIVPGKRFKSEYASTHSILIDDTESVIEDFNNAGGNALLYTGNVEKTLSDLRDLLFT